MKKILSLTLALLMILSLFAGCGGNSSGGSGGTSEGNSSAGDTPQDALVSDVGDSQASMSAADKTAAVGQIESVSYALNSPSFDLKPFSSPASGRAQIFNLIWPRLVYLTSYGGTLEDAEMWLAKKVTRVDDVTCDVELYDYIYDNKGNHITAEDVKWSYEMVATVGQSVEIGSLLESIDILDDYNLRFTLSSPGTGKMETVLGFHRMAICDKDWYENASEEELLSDCATAAAYYIKEFTAGSRVVLEAVDNYWQADESLRGISGTQNVKTIYCPVIAEAAVRAISLENHEIDFTDVDISALGQFFDNGAAKEGYNVLPVGGTTALDLFLNMDEASGSPVATNLKLRQAILTAIDADSVRMAAGLNDSSSWLCYDFGTPLMAGHDKAWEENYFNYDPAKAKELLAEAGYPNGIDLRFMYTSYMNAGMVAVLTENLEAVGIHVEVLGFDQALYNTYKYDSSVWDIEIDNKGGYSLIDHWNNLFSPGGYTNGGVNFFKDQALYDAVDKAMLTGAQEDYEAVHSYLVEAAIGRGLYAQATIYVSQDGILNMIMNHYMYPMINAWTYAEGFTSNYSA